MSDELVQFADQRFINLETYRKSGKAVQTPLRFVERDGVLYAAAPSQTGKVKRVRNGSTARVVPCTNNGTPKGTWVDADIRIVDGSTAEQARLMLKRNYSWQYMLVHAFGFTRRWRYVMFAIRPGHK